MQDGNGNNWGDGFAAFGSGAAAGTLSLYGPAGWAAGGFLSGSVNTWLNGVAFLMVFKMVYLGLLCEAILQVLLVGLQVV